MKKVLILLLLVLVACAVPIEPAGGDNVQDTTPEPTPIEIETQEEIVETSPTVVDSIDEDVKQLLGRMGNIQSYSYHDTRGTLDTFHIRGDMVRIDLHNQKQYNELYSYDTVLWDRSSGSVLGYCTDSGFCDARAREVYFEVKYPAKGTILDALGIADDWVSAHFTGSTEQLDRTQVREVAFKLSATKNGTALLDNYYGVPHVIQYYESGNPTDRIEFTSLKIDTVKEKDMSIDSDFTKID
jgi:hypothetical protein